MGKKQNGGPQAMLLARKAELEKSSNQSQESREVVDLDQTRVGRLSRMDAMQAQAMSQAMERRRQHELLRIDAALKRLGDGENGYCISCGEAVEPGRLQLDPSAAQCTKCAGG